MIGEIAVLTHKLCVSVEAAEDSTIVWIGLIVIVPPSVATIQLFPVVLMAYVKGDPVVVVGVPDIVKVVPATVAVTPVGKPVTFAPVAPPPNV